MDASLASLPSDVLRIMLDPTNCGWFCFGVVGRVCRALHAKINSMEDMWERMAAITPQVDALDGGPSVGESKVASSRSKLNQFAALVKRLKLGQCNVSCIRESRRPYFPNWRESASDDPKDVGNGDTDVVEEYFRYNEGLSNYTYDIIHSAGSKTFALATSARDHELDWMETYINTVKEHKIKNPFDSPRDLMGTGFPTAADATMIGDRFIWSRMGNRGDKKVISIYNMETKSLFEADLSEATTISDPSSFYISNCAAQYPWMLIICFSASECEAIDTAFSFEPVGPDFVRGPVSPSRQTLAIYDFAEGRFLLQDTDLRDEGRIEGDIAFWGSHFIIGYKRKLDGCKYSTCYHFDTIGGLIRSKWTTDGSVVLLHSDGFVASLIVNGRQCLMSLNDGSILVDSGVKYDAINIMAPRLSGTARLLIQGSEIYDILDSSQPIFKCLSARITLLDASHWLVVIDHSLYFFDFESPYQTTNSFIKCCALGERSLGEPDRDQVYAVNCKATAIDLPSASIFDGIAKLIGCSPNQLIGDRLNHYDRMSVQTVPICQSANRPSYPPPYFPL
jgi:hypothetical protein